MCCAHDDSLDGIHGITKLNECVVPMMIAQSRPWWYQLDVTITYYINKFGQIITDTKWYTRYYTFDNILIDMTITYYTNQFG